MQIALFNLIIFFTLYLYLDFVFVNSNLKKIHKYETFRLNIAISESVEY